MYKFTQNNWVRAFFVMSRQVFLAWVITASFGGMLMAHSGKSQKMLSDFTITLNESNSGLFKVLNQIEKQTDFKFSYLDELSRKIKVSVEAKNASLDKILEEIGKSGKVKFRRVNDMIAVSKARKIHGKFFVKEEFEAEVEVSGKITDENGQGLPGASIVVKGTTNGTTSDLDGNYKLSVPENSVVIISFVGYITREVEVGSRSVIDLQMEVDAGQLEEVVVVGYGTVKKSDVTGAVSSITSQDISELPLVSPQDAIQGRVAGVDVISTGTTPGSNSNIRIRGRRSFAAGNDPLFIVDGIPFSGALNDINPSDIQSMEVLKDASATAIYGSRGANGVILITTKRGGNAKTTISYDSYYGVSSAINRVPVKDGYAFAELRRETARQNGTYDESNPAVSDGLLFSDYELESLALGRFTDWQDLTLKNGVQQSHQIGVSGGNEKSNYMVSLNYFEEDGVVEGYDFERYSLRVNVDQKIGSRVKVGVSTLISGSTKNGDGYGTLSPYFNSLALNPLYGPYDAEGNIINQPDPAESLLRNPLLDQVPGAVVKEDKRFRSFSSIYAEVEIIEGLSYRVNFGPDFQYDRRGEYTASASTEGRDSAPSAGFANGTTFAYTFENILKYSKTFGGKHAIDFTGLFSQQQQTRESYGTDVTDVPIEAFTFRRLGDGNVTGYRSGYNQWSILSFMARANYNYDGRYFMTVTARRDGSSRFAPGKKYGTFPSIAVGWNISEETFLASSSVVSFLKLRASHGTIGNTGIGPYTTLGSIARNTYTFGDSGVSGYRANGAPNPNLSWESTTSTNIGLDFGFLSGRISGSINWYKQSTFDLLLNRSLPPTGGTNNVILQNVGKTSNEGFELNISSTNINSSGFKWTTDFNIYTNSEKIVDIFGDGLGDDVGNLWFIGQPLTVYYDFQKTGIWQLGEEAEAAGYQAIPGQIKVADLAGRDENDNPVAGADGSITDVDRVILGSDIADWSAGITNRFSYKGLDFSFFIFTRQGSLIRGTTGGGNGRWNNQIVDYWTADNPTNAFPQPSNSGTPYGSSAAYFDGSYVQVKNVQLGYQLPIDIISKVGMSSLRVYMSMRDPLIFSKYNDLHGFPPFGAGNPPSGGSEVVSSVSSSALPPTKLIMFGINAKF
ncbi:MAG: SusC/RagA family TonB-linked outer membrane protein [Cyclobacteriaceae bacterium]